jgi:hypothetical protein
MNFKIFWNISICTIGDGLSQKTISRYCPFKLIISLNDSAPPPKWQEQIQHNVLYTVIRFVSTRAKFGICTVMALNRTFVEDKMCTF